NLTAAEVGI
ncbi:flagellar protein FliS, partial [Vibrio parahaemolyticus AQ3810]